MENVTAESILISIGVIAAFLTFIALVWKGVESWRKLTHAESREANVQRITNCEERLTEVEDQYKCVRSDMTETLNVLNGMLMHFISGNDHDKLRVVKSQLDEYMSQR